MIIHRQPQVPSNTDRAVLARLNRKLAHQDLKVHRCRDSSRNYHDLGDYFVMDFQRCIAAKDIDIRDWLAEECGENNPTIVPLPPVNRQSVDQALLAGPWFITTSTKSGETKTTEFDPDCCHDGGGDFDAETYFDARTHELIHCSCYAVDNAEELKERCKWSPNRYWKMPSQHDYDARGEALEFVENEITGAEHGRLWGALNDRGPMRNFRMELRELNLLDQWEGWEWIVQHLLIINAFREHGVNPVPVKS